MSEFTTTVLSEAERRLAAVRAELESMSASEAQDWRDRLCRAVESGDAMESGSIVPRIRAVVAARAEQAAQSASKSEAAKIESVRAELLKHPHFVRVVHALAVEICALGTTPAMLCDLADDIARAGKKLR